MLFCPCGKPISFTVSDCINGMYRASQVTDYRNNSHYMRNSKIANTYVYYALSDYTIHYVGNIIYYRFVKMCASNFDFNNS